jgi:hypothetical protein
MSRRAERLSKPSTFTSIPGVAIPFYLRVLRTSLNILFRFFVHEMYFLTEWSERGWIMNCLITVFMFQRFNIYSTSIAVEVNLFPCPIRSTQSVYERPGVIGEVIQ